MTGTEDGRIKLAHSISNDIVFEVILTSKLIAFKYEGKDRYSMGDYGFDWETINELFAKVSKVLEFVLDGRISHAPKPMINNFGIKYYEVDDKTAKPEYRSISFSIRFEHPDLPQANIVIYPQHPSLKNFDINKINLDTLLNIYQLVHSGGIDADEIEQKYEDKNWRSHYNNYSFTLHYDVSGFMLDLRINSPFDFGKC